METRKIILTRGIQGSGKSTWAKAWVLEDPEHRVRINRDDIRNMLGKYWVSNRENLVTNIEDSAISNALWEKYNVVIDNMNLNPKTVQKIKDIVDRWNSIKEHNTQYELEFKDFFISVEECILRDSMRPNPIGEKVIRETWKKYRNTIINIENNRVVEDIKKNYVIDGGTCIIVDMDATLCFNISGRPFYGEGASDGIMKDVMNPGTCEIVRSLNRGLHSSAKTNIFIITGRNEDCREMTEKWLNHYDIPYDHVYMRPNGDYTKGEDFKKKVYEEHIKGKYNVLFVLEDSQRCVNMYRSLGLTVLQPNEGKF